MLRRSTTFAALAVVIAGAGPALADPAATSKPAVAPGHVPEPAGLNDGALHGYTPGTISGGSVIDTAQLSKLVEEKHPLLLDVAEKDRKPPSMSKDTPWFPIHRSIPGAIFLQGGGSGTPDPRYETAFLARVAALTGDDKTKPIVTFCHPDCWGSYNAAKRLIRAGYTNVDWYRDGTEGWQADHDTRVVKPDPRWVEAMPKPATE